MAIFGGGSKKPQNSSTQANPDQAPYTPEKGDRDYIPALHEHPMTDSEILDMLDGESD